MPKGKGFVSSQQRKFAFATDQSWAEKWGKESKGKKLPTRVKPKSKSKSTKKG